MKDKASMTVKWRIIGGMAVIILTFTIWYYQEHHDMEDSHHGEKKKEVATQKSELEIGLEFAETVYTETKEISKNNKERNNAIIANRKKRLVYQIGDVKDNEEAILSLYLKLKEIESVNMSRIFVFKIKRNKYFLYSDNGYSEEQINDSLASFVYQTKQIEPYIEIINLLASCNAKEQIVDKKPIKSKKEKVEIPRCECD